MFHRLATETEDIVEMEEEKNEQKIREKKLLSGEINIGSYLASSYTKLKDLYKESEADGVERYLVEIDMRNLRKVTQVFQ